MLINDNQLKSMKLIDCILSSWTLYVLNRHDKYLSNRYLFCLHLTIIIIIGASPTLTMSTLLLSVCVYIYM